ncbi:C2H2-type domain-containing protein, partial [Aphis craccivora]
MEVQDLDALVVHYKIIHVLKPNSTYTCCEESCSQSFNALSSFKRHVLKKHICVHVSPNMQQNVQNSEMYNTLTHNLNNTNDCEQENVLNDPVTIFNFDNEVNLLYESTIKFVLSLYNHNNFNNSDVLFIQAGIKDFILKPMASILKHVKNEINDAILLSKFHKFETILLDPFLYCSTEYRLCNWLKQRNLMSNMYQININNAIVPVDHVGNINYDEKITKGTLLPIKIQFKQFFEKENNFKIFYDKFLEYTYSNDDCILNFIQGKLWKEKVQQYEGKLVFPYFIYMDDFEINNPLGSHATFQSIAAIYYNFPFSINNSKLSNIFLAALIKSTDIKQFGNDPCFKSFINELNEIER